MHLPAGSHVTTPRIDSSPSRPGQHKLRRRALAHALSLCLALGATHAHAQATTATLRGQVHGVTNGNAAHVFATHEGTGYVHRVTARPDGSYVLAGLSPGTYTISVDAGGTSRIDTITLRLGESATLDFSADGGAESKRTEPTSEVGQHVSREQISRLPQDARDVFSFADIVPGVHVDTQPEGSIRLRSGALPASAVNVFVDGVGQKNYVRVGGVSGQIGSLGYAMPQSAVSGYRVITQNYKAEYDQASGAAIVVATESGTNEFKGSAFVDHVADQWRAATPNELANDTRSEKSFGQYGVTFGGPIVPDAMHFFVSYEGREKSDPKDVHFGGPIPAGGLPSFIADQLGPAGTPFNLDLLFGKLSWAPGDDQHVDLSLRHRTETELTNIGAILTPESGNARDIDETHVDLQHRYFGAGFINDVHLTFEDVHYDNHPITDAPGYELQASATDFRRLIYAGGGFNQSAQRQDGIGIRDDLTFTGIDWHGEHTIKVGASYKAIDLEATSNFGTNPLFTYDYATSLTTPFAVRFASPLPGTGDRTITSDNSQFGVYFQDDWAVGDRLTLNLGVRWDIEETPGYEDHVTRPALAAALRSWTNLSNTDYDIEDYISDGSNRGSFKDAIAPRLGFTYDLGDDNTHVLFGGAGRAYDRNLFSTLAFEQLAGTNPTYDFRFNVPGNPCSGANCVDWNPAFFDPANLRALVAANPNFRTESYVLANDLKTPYSDQFSLGLSSTFGDWQSSVTLSHVRSKDGIVFRLGNRYADGGFRNGGVLPFGQAVPGHGLLILGDNGAETRNDSLLVSLEKPYSLESGWGTTIAYTFSDAQENLSGAAANGEPFLLDLLDVNEVGWIRASGIPRHRLVATGIYDGAFGIRYSAKATLESENTYVAQNCLDAPNFSECRFDPFTPSGTFGREQVDIAVSREWLFGDGYAVNFRIDALNLFNTRNWNSYNTFRGFLGTPNPMFGTHDDSVLLPTRTLKATVGFRW